METVSSMLDTRITRTLLWAGRRMRGFSGVLILTGDYPRLKGIHIRKHEHVNTRV